MNEPMVHPVRPRPIAPRLRDHFFGYYELNPWDATGRYLLAGQTDFVARRPTPDDGLTLTRVELATGRAEELAVTHGWDWQMGARAHWLSGGPAIIYNDRRDGRLVSVVLDTQSGRERVLPMPIYCTTPDGRWAITLNFDRLDLCRPGYGIGGTGYHGAAEATDDEGLFRMDLQAGRAELIVSLRQLASIEPAESMAGAAHWVNHLQLNPSATRFSFLHRWGDAGGRWATRMFTADLDGGNLFLLNREPMTSHTDWLDDRRLLAWAERDRRSAYWLFTDRSAEAEVIGEPWFDRDGHCRFSPDRRWMVTDTYPHGTTHRSLIVYRWPDGPRIDIGRFLSPSRFAGPDRCDLHTRWSADGQTLCMDSTHEDRRAMYLLDVREVLDEFA
ncbi:MAG: hypothetical protein BIFFINMI_02261 [Phycisphaerae bacterium]|nr:hypothetical protein [Phycisphaerae bacterium]